MIFLNRDPEFKIYNLNEDSIEELFEDIEKRIQTQEVEVYAADPYAGDPGANGDMGPGGDINNNSSYDASLGPFD